MTKYLLLFLLLFRMLTATAQKAYIIKEKGYSNGSITNKRIAQNNRSIEFFSTPRSAPVTFLPADLDEFGMSNGDVYVTREVLADNGRQQFFLFRLVDGKTKLYELKTKKNTLFFEEDSLGIKPINKESLQSSLAELLPGCPDFQDVIKQARYKRSSLQPIFTAYKSCYTRFIPRSRKGFIAGFSSDKFTLGGLGFTGQSIPLKGSNVMIGAFTENPIGSKGHWYTNVQAIFQLQNYSSDTYKVSAALVHFPVLFKYRTTGTTLRGFVNAGPAPGFYLKRENIVIEQDYSLNSIPLLELSAIAGAGVEYSVNPVNFLSAELRVVSGRGIGATINKQTFTGVQVLVAMYF